MTGGEIALPLGKSALAALAKRFGVVVAERWSKHRTQQFFSAFVEAIQQEQTNKAEFAEVDELLNGILSSDPLSEELFDAYRRVCLSKSKDLGPKVIGHLVARIVGEKRRANGVEEEVFAAAESLSDSELMELYKGYFDILKEAELASQAGGRSFDPDGMISLRLAEEKADSNWGPTLIVEIGEPSLAEIYGGWARKLRGLGMIELRTTQTKEERSHPDGRLEVLKVQSTCYFSRSCGLLHKLIGRSLGAATGGPVE